MDRLIQYAAASVAAAFPGRALIPAAQGWEFVGGNGKTSRNLICQGRFPLALIKRGRQNFVPAGALVSYLAEQLQAAGWTPPLAMIPAGSGIPTPSAAASTAPAPALRGRPSREEEVRARAAGLSVREWRLQQRAAAAQQSRSIDAAGRQS
ncbi:hypothetical protein [Rhodocyclus tenuis]|uniref:Uncharacterized protein n=1 Tax=Rhodocyclus tenuis TaxID=1066 RepID=A0A840G141_RHOTE|nr:hypothetical protein [Rhodocyclus tenuis]MBB4247954.1 hypothetical protein [Rhodocyclus tenuis]